MTFKLYAMLSLCAVFLISPFFASAANISSPSYAWSESVGWFKFDSVLGAVTVSDSALSGHAYNDNTGWLALSGVTNDGQGNLGGYAWSESVGYVNFDGVTIFGVEGTHSDEFVLRTEWSDNIGLNTRANAITACTNLVAGGHSDWGLPTAPEFVHAYLSEEVDLPEDDAYWTLSRREGVDESYAINFNSSGGLVEMYSDNLVQYLTKCVR